MIKLFTHFVFLLVFISSCTNKGNSTDIFTDVYNTENLATQNFYVNGGIENIITGANGTKIRIPKNAFVDSAGQIVLDSIEIQLKEALTMQDIVLANLTTTTNGKALETGGMIYINAISKGKNLTLDTNKSILIALPSDSTLEGMSLYSGEKNITGVNWTNPTSLFNANPDSTVISMDKFEKTTNIKYSVDGFDDSNNFPDTVNNEVSRIAWEGDGLKISKDSVIKIGNYTVRFYKREIQKWSMVFSVKKGANNYVNDVNTYYFFSMNKLGWANIDRLLNDPRTEEVELITSVDNQKDFNYVYVTLITNKMYLPGYQKMDNTYSFSHDDSEPQKLPIGEKATIMATAYKNNIPYFAIQSITISRQQKISFTLLETTLDNIRADLKEKLK